jgi:WhiB family redox-sensing transcriptional regulator
MDATFAIPASRLPDNDDPQLWRSAAMCLYVDPDLFYPEQGAVAKVRAAKRICDTCPVVARCLADALANDERFGVWGGKTERERRQLRRALRDEIERGAE